MNNFFLGLFTIIAVILASFIVSYLAGVYYPNDSSLISFLRGMFCSSLGMMFYIRNSLYRL